MAFDIITMNQLGACDVGNSHLKIHLTTTITIEQLQVPFTILEY